MITRNKSGFTLLEVIIVIIIIAILASVAMPKVTQALHFAKAKEALGVIPPMRTALDACAMMSSSNSNYTGCGANATALGVSFSGKYFGEPTVSGLGVNTYTINVPGNSGLGNIIFTNANGAITGTGNFVNFKSSNY